MEVKTPARPANKHEGSHNDSRNDRARHQPTHPIFPTVEEVKKQCHESIGVNGRQISTLRVVEIGITTEMRLIRHYILNQTENSVKGQHTYREFDRERPRRKVRLDISA